MNALSVDIKDRLVAQSVGTFRAASGWGIYIDSFPREPDSVVLIMDADGGEPERSMSPTRTAGTLDHDMVQIQVRDGDYNDAHNKMRDVVDALEKNGIRWSVAGSSSGEADVAVEGVFATSGTQSLGRDDGDRYVFSRNYRAIRREKI